LSSRPLPAGFDRLETPVYLYDLDELRASHTRLRAALPSQTQLYYSLKANPHPSVVTKLRTLGCLAEVCSPGELRTALEAGFAAAGVLYTGPGKREQDLVDAVKAGVELFSVDSPHGLDQLDTVARRLTVSLQALIRINDDAPAPGQRMTMTGVASQFGADAAWVLAEPARFGPRGAVRPVGFHLYMGSNIVGRDALLAQFRQAAATAARLAGATGIQVRLLDLGGGFGAPFARVGELPPLDGLDAGIEELLDGTFPGWRDGRPAVTFESGRYLTATCGTLLTRVLDVKQSHGRAVIVLESGVNHLGGLSGLRRLPPIVPDLVWDVGGPATEPVETIVAGPLCTPVDTWARAAPLPAVAPGQLVRVPNVGAYGLNASLVAFLGHPLPAEATVEAGRITNVSRVELLRQTVTDASRGDQQWIPAS